MGLATPNPIRTAQLSFAASFVRTSTDGALIQLVESFRTAHPEQFRRLLSIIDGVTLAGDDD